MEYMVHAVCTQGKKHDIVISSLEEDLCSWFIEIASRDRPAVSVFNYARAVGVFQRGLRVPLDTKWKTLFVGGRQRYVVLHLMLKSWTVASNFDRTTFVATCPLTGNELEQPTLCKDCTRVFENKDIEEGSCPQCKR
jgi:hypothetical protein